MRQVRLARPSEPDSCVDLSRFVHGAPWNCTFEKHEKTPSLLQPQSPNPKNPSSEFLLRKKRPPTVAVNAGLMSYDSSPNTASSWSWRCCAVSQIVSGQPGTSWLSDMPSTR